MKVVISGYYGFNNTGDEAILSSMISRLRKKDPGIELTVLSRTPKETSARFKVSSVQRLNPFSVFGAILSSDIFISGGGGLFQDSTGRFSPVYYLSLLLAAILFGKKTVVFGQGFGPLKRAINRALARYVLDRTDLVTVRDFLSKKALRSEGITSPAVLACADPALLLEKEPFSEILNNEEISEFERPTVGVCLRAFRNMPEDLTPRIAEALDAFIDKNGSDLLFIPFKAPDDTQLSVSVLSLMKNKGRVIEGDYSPGQILSLIGSLDMVIGMRLHSLVFASASEVPALGISYDPKVRAFCDDSGYPCLDPDFSPGALCEQAENIWKKRDAIRREVSEKLKLLKYKAALNFEAFFEYFGMNSVINILGVRIDNIDSDAGIRKVESFINSGKPRLILTPNPEIIMSAGKDQKLLKLLNSSDLNLPDGIGIVAAAKILGSPVRGRLTGIDFMASILDLCRRRGYSVFLLGGKPGVADEAAEKMEGIRIAGTHHGYFSDGDDAAIVEQIKRTKPDVLFAGLGSPRQEFWLSKYYKDIGASVNMVIGGSLDVLSGRMKRAPKLMRNTGIEWLYRLAKEPKRLRRQTSLARFAWAVIRNRKREGAR